LNCQNTIVDAIKVVLQKESPLAYDEIYKRIISQKLYDFGARDPKAIVGGMLRRHCYGKDFPSASPTKHFIISETKGRKSLYDIWDKKEHSLPASPRNIPASDQLPEELLVENHIQHLNLIRQEILATISEASPGFFEKLVIRLLLKMGYGWDELESGMVTGGAYDEGIDGVINGDKLGLDKVYMQAKRYAAKNSVGGKEMREFIGAMALKGAQKGVFITSSKFTPQAIKHVKDIKNINISLIEGHYLADLLMQHKLGVKAVKSFTTYIVDKEDFFD